MPNFAQNMRSVRNQAEQGSEYRDAMTPKENARHRGAMACVGGLRNALRRPGLFLFGRLFLGCGGAPRRPPLRRFLPLPPRRPPCPPPARFPPPRPAPPPPRCP